MTHREWKQLRWQRNPRPPKLDPVLSGRRSQIHERLLAVGEPYCDMPLEHAAQPPISARKALSLDREIALEDLGAKPLALLKDHDTHRLDRRLHLCPESLALPSIPHQTRWTRQDSNPCLSEVAFSPSTIGNLGRVEYTGKTPALKRAAVFAREIEDLAAGMKQRIKSGSRAIGHREA